MSRKKVSKSQTEDKPKVGLKSSQGLTALLLSLPSILAAVLVPVMLIGLFQVLVIPDFLSKHNDVLSESYAQRFVDPVKQQLKLLENSIKKAAHQESVINALNEGNSASLFLLEQQIAQLVPGVVNAKIFPIGKYAIDDSVTPPVNFAALDMIRKTERGTPITPEVHWIDGKKFLRIATLIKPESAEQGIGTLLVAVDFNQFFAFSPKLDGSKGYLEIVQSISGAASKPIQQQGDPKWKADTQYKKEQLIAGVPWTVQFYPSPQLTPQNLESPLVWSLLAVGILLLLLLNYVVTALFRSSFNKDCAAFTNYFKSYISNPNGTVAYSWQGMVDATLHATSAIATYKPKAKESSPAQKDSEAATSTTADPLFQDDVLDIAMLEEDENLLNINSEDDQSGSSEMTASRVNVPGSIFRAYDIRGIVGDTLTAEVVYYIGKAVASEALAVGDTAVAVGRDGRLSGPELSQALISGITSTGCNVINVGMVPTPVLYYATNTLNTKSGIMLTGSHNPPNYNGLKMVVGGTTLSGETIQQLKSRIEENNLSEGKGSVEEVDILDDYVDYIVNDVVLAKPMTVAIDCGNGVAGVVAEKLFSKLGCEVIPLFCDVDGNFPNHHPDPSKPENLKDLINTVQKANADIGLAFDGDGDRVGVVTPQGKIIFADRLMMLYAKDLLSRNPGADIIYDVKCSRDLTDLIGKNGGRAVMWKTGHSFIKAKLKETNAVIAGEMSGHIFFNDRWFGFDDGLYSAARLLEILAMETRETDEIFDDFPNKPSTPELNITVTDENKFDIVARLQARGEFGDGKLMTIDGVRVDYPNAWGLVRASNTTPVLVARFEADTEEDLQLVKEIFHNELLKIDSSLEIPF